MKIDPKRHMEEGMSYDEPLLAVMDKVESGAFEMGFDGRAAAHKPKITMRNAKRRLEWCQACRHWTLEEWKRVLWSDESRFTKSNQKI